MTWINRGPLGKGNWITDEHGRQIAVTYSERINPKSVEDTAKILAAEDMLKALRGIVDAYGGDVPDWLVDKFAAAEDAIAKAEGRADG